MKLIYNNFDGLDISFQGALPEPVLEQLAEAKNKAQQERRGVYAQLGENKMPVMVAETGASGGYRYRFDTGIDGETWFIGHSINSKEWNIRVSVKSLSLALKGYEGAKAAILNRLIALNAIGPSSHDDNGRVINRPLERISRFDYCFDFAMDDAFMPQPYRFIAHQRAKKHCYGEQGQITNYSAGSGERIDTIRIGEMPGRQAVLYNKTKEIRASSKKYWWDIWGFKEAAFKETFKEIWRVEIRAGKGELDKWGLKRFEDFEDKAGDVVASILKAIRYTEPLKEDVNRSRWPMAGFWQESLNSSFKALASYSTNAIRAKIISDYRENIESGYKERIVGNAIGLAAVQGRDVSELPIVMEELQDEIAAIAQTNIALLIKKHEKATEKFEFLK